MEIRRPYFIYESDETYDRFWTDVGRSRNFTSMLNVIKNIILETKFENFNIARCDMSYYATNVIIPQKEFCEVIGYIIEGLYLESMEYDKINEEEKNKFKIKLIYTITTTNTLLKITKLVDLDFQREFEDDMYAYYLPFRTRYLFEFCIDNKVFGNHKIEELSDGNQIKNTNILNFLRMFSYDTFILYDERDVDVEEIYIENGNMQNIHQDWGQNDMLFVFFGPRNIDIDEILPEF